jgi:NADH-quinone oxidoreductase subunit C
MTTTPPTAITFHQTKSLEAMAPVIKELLGHDLVEWCIDKDHGVITTYNEAVARVCTLLKDDPRLYFHQLIDICGVDYHPHTPRFEVVYHLLSTIHNQRLRIRIKADESMRFPTLSTVFKAAPWYEREVFDLYGIVFEGHGDLRRILTDYHFDGHPLRKDFPLMGYVEPRYDDTEKEVIYGSVTLPQDFRSFHTMSPWEGDWSDLLSQERLKGVQDALKNSDKDSNIPKGDKA